MHKTYRYKPRYAGRRLPLPVKGLALIFLLCAVVRLFSVLGAEDASANYMSNLVSNDSVIDSILRFELGYSNKETNVSLASLFLDTGILDDTTQAAVTDDIPSSETPVSGENGIPFVFDPGLFYNDWEDVKTESDDIPDVITLPAGKTDASTIAINNKTEYAVDTTALLSEPLNITLTGDSPAVLIIHTHGSEAYLPDANDKYEESDPYRTQQKEYSVIRIGDELASALAKQGISFIHDRGVYDYPSYNGSYTRSYEAIQSYLKKYPSIKMVIDLHRDALEAKDGTPYKTIAQFGDTTCSQVKFVVGTDFSGLTHPNWRENLKLALHIQQAMNTQYPSLAKPITLHQLRYNQQATTGSMLVEIGSTGNTLQESLTAIRCFADSLSTVVLDLYK